MATFSAVTREHILQAIAEYDTRGGDDFLGVYGFAPTAGYSLIHEGRGYDSKAILGVAHRYATGRVATSDEFHGGMTAAAAVLRKHGFEVTERVGAKSGARSTAARSTTPRSTTPRSTTPRQPVPPRRPAVADRPLPICPTCSMALPGTGVCDNCG